MKPLSRRSFASGLALAAATVPALGLCAVRKNDHMDRIKHHTRELEKAMRDRYGVEVQVLTFDDSAGMKPSVFVVAHTN
jgi:hypothetical protein